LIASVPRTGGWPIVLADGVALLQAGAGIVVDSDPAAEHEECLRKLAALEMAIALAEARQ
jgi:anthranilate synthase component I